MEKAFYKQNTLTDYTTPPPPSDLPRQVGPYKIESLLSQGGMSILYLGLHPQNRELLAIKVLSPQFVNHPEMTQQFLKEAKIIGLTSHPNIVKLYGQGTWEGGLYIAMEFIRGVSLKQFILQQSLSLKRSIDILLQVSYALYHLHSHNVIHGDLKPENILITEDGEVKVIDFGISRLHEDNLPLQKKGMTQAGTPNYMSPEQKENHSHISFATDIYSLGIIAYELILGKLSFGVIHPTLLPKGIRKIIEKALASSPSERYQKIVDFITDLSNYLKSGEVERDRPGADQLKEVVESLQRTTQALSPAVLPPLPQVELGLIKYKAPLRVGSYFDCFRFTANAYGFLIAEASSQSLDACIYIANLRGTIRTLIADKEGKPLPPKELATKLNQFCKSDFLAETYAFSYLLLSTLQDSLSYISCGLGGLLHLPQGRGTPHLLTQQNPLLGKENSPEFLEISDNWEVGDALTLHSFDSSLNEALLEAVSENSLLSAQGQAEALVKKASLHPQFTAPLNPKVLLTIHRTG